MICGNMPSSPRLTHGHKVWGSHHAWRCETQGLRRLIANASPCFLLGKRSARNCLLAPPSPCQCFTVLIEQAECWTCLRAPPLGCQWEGGRAGGQAGGRAVVIGRLMFVTIGGSLRQCGATRAVPVALLDQVGPSMSELVEPDTGELVEDEDPLPPSGMPPPSHRGPRVDVVVLLRRHVHASGGHQAVAVLQVQTSVALPEDDATPEQRSVRGPSVPDGHVAFYAEHRVVHVQQLEAPVDMGQDISALSLRRELRRHRHSRTALALLESSLHRGVALVTAADAFAARLLDGSLSLLSSVPLSSSRSAARSQLPMRAPTAHEFRAASARRANVHGLVYRPRKQRRGEPSMTDIRRQVF
jgi:hypothetical protein